MSTVPPVTNNNTAGSTNSDLNTQAQQGLNSNFQDFLKLLTTQLQNQDPTQPADVNQMTTELAQLSQVEQQINSNKLLNQLVTMLGTTQVSNAVSYIGKQVDATGNKFALSNGQAELVYNLPSNATTADVTITNAAGQTVFSGKGTTTAGRNQLIWDGTNSISGAKMPNGTYTFKVASKDSDGKAVDVTTFTTGTVASVDTQNGTNTLSLGSGLSVPLNSVQSIYNVGTNPGA